MQIKLHHYFGILTAAAIVLANTALGFADDMETMQVEVISVGATDESTPDLSSPQEESMPTPEQQKEEFLRKLQQELNLSKTEYHQLVNSIAETQKRLDSVAKQKLSITQQLQNLDDAVNIATKKLMDVVYQKIEAENQITLIYEQIQMKEIALKQQKQALKDYLRLLYEQENALIGVDQNGEVEALKLLLSDETVGNNLKEFKYFSLLSETGQQMVDKLDQLNNELLDYKEKLKRDKIHLQGLQEKLALEKQNLDQQKQSKENFMKVTSGQEMIYSQLLEQSVREQQQSLSDINALADAYSALEQKVRNSGSDFNIDEYLKLLDSKTQVLYDFTTKNPQINRNGFAWAVVPTRGLSAYFHDPSYKASMGMNHNAVDIPTLQGSLVHAAADGVVYTTKDNGYGYSYIIVAHADGFMSVYGHMSNIQVKEGDIVNQGDVLGLSGGMPGTKGAGYMTTGPHLHFELLKNGGYVDPLEYLPMDQLSYEAVSKLPSNYMDMWREAVAVSRLGAIGRRINQEIELSQ